jgi:hypothetical protein
VSIPGKTLLPIKVCIRSDTYVKRNISLEFANLGFFLPFLS